MRELDVFVAKRIMGYKQVQFDGLHCDYFGYPPNSDEKNTERIPRYTTHLPSAWTVVRQMKRDGFSFGLTFQPFDESDASYWEASFIRIFHKVPR